MTDRQMPHDLDVERALLGAVMLDPWRYEDVSETIAAASFHHPAHGIVWDAVGRLRETQTVDLLSICDILERDGTLESVGGRTYVADLLQAVPTSANISRYAGIVADMAARRDLIRMALGLVDAAHDGDQIGTHIDSAMEALTTLQHATDHAGATGAIPMSALMPAVVDYIQAVQDGDETQLGITTGFPDLDRFCRLRAGEMIVIAARPSIGKSALMWCMARNQAMAGIPVGIFSYEMSAQSLARRALWAETGIAEHDVRDGILSAGAWGALRDGARRLADSHTFIDERRGNMLQLRARARRMVQKHGVRVIYIDYLQLIPEQRQSKSRSRENAVAVLSSSIKALAQELNIPVVILAQLNREAENTKKAKETLENSRPRLSHLRESGAIEQDADVVLLLHRMRLAEDGRTELLVEKQRNGPTGIVPMLWQAKFTRFVQAAREGSAAEMARMVKEKDWA